MNENEIRAAAVKANLEATRAWNESGDCATYRAAMAEYRELCELYARATGRLLRV